MIVPGQPSAAPSPDSDLGGTRPSQTALLMAMAQMHQLGRLAPKDQGAPPATPPMEEDDQTTPTTQPPSPTNVRPLHKRGHRR